jgi:hypothetical protein
VNGLLTAREAAALLGLRKEDTVRAMGRSGKLTPVPHGTRSWRYREAEVRGLVEGTPSTVELTDAQIDAVAARVLARLGGLLAAPADELAPRRQGMAG